MLTARSDKRLGRGGPAAPHIVQPDDFVPGYLQGSKSDPQSVSLSKPALGEWGMRRAGRPGSIFVLFFTLVVAGSLRLVASPWDPPT